MELTQLNEVLSIGIVGIGLTFVVEYLKSRFGTTSDANKLIVIALAVLLGAGYWFVVDTALWQPIIGILSASTVFYSFFVKESKM